MSDADDAYIAALNAIEAARFAIGGKLDLSGEAFHALEEIPPSIAELERLRVLNLSESSVSDLSPLRGLTNLRHLLLVRTRVADLTPLSGLHDLATLNLNRTQVSDLSPLRNHTSLGRLWLAGTKVSDFSALSGFVRLTDLTLDGTEISDLSVLKPLTRLEALHIDETEVSDLSPLQRLTGLRFLSFNRTRMADLAPLENLPALTHLACVGCPVADLTPLHRARNLEWFAASYTLIDDLSPLRHLTKLRRLRISDTSVKDLRPILAMGALSATEHSGLDFRNTPAADSSADLTRLSEIADPQDCARETLAYLATLPPYPDPLPWEDAKEASAETAPPAPEPAGVPVLLLTEDQHLDLTDSPPTAEELGDPIKARLYRRLPDAAQELVRFGNLYPELRGPSEALRDLVAVDFAEADILAIHLEIAALVDARDANRAKPGPERFDPDCSAALDALLRVGPPVTMGHPDVELMEERNRAFANRQRPPAVPEGEREVAGGLAQETALTTERLRAQASLLSRAGDQGRLASYRADFSRNAVIVLSFVVGPLGQAALGYIPGTVVAHAVDFLLLHHHAILAIAPSWGEGGLAWAEYVIAWARRLRDTPRQ